MKIVIDEVLKVLRSERGLTQEALSEKMGVSVQAVSKWENGLSCPDIALLPGLADFLGVTVDHLLTGRENKPVAALLPDDGVLRVVQAVGGRLLGAEECSEEIKLIIPENCPCTLNAEIRCGCSIEGDISGDVNVNGELRCGNVDGMVNAGDGVICGNVGGSVTAGDGVTCGNVGSSITAGDGVTCGDVGGSVTAGDGVNCRDIAANASAGDGIRCRIIGGNADCGGNIECNEIKGSVKCEGDINYSKDRVVKD